MLTGFVDEKKSMSFPIVKGTLMDTAEETKRRPIAMSSGFFSGLASAAIFLKEDEPASSLRKACAILFHTDSFGGVGGSGVTSGGGVAGVGEVEDA